MSKPRRAKPVGHTAHVYQEATGKFPSSQLSRYLRTPKKRGTQKSKEKK